MSKRKKGYAKPKQTPKNFTAPSDPSAPAQVGALHASTFKTKMKLPVVNWSDFALPWIKFDRDNLFPNRISEWKLSPYHGAALRTTSTILYGTGLEFKEDETNAFYPTPLQPYLTKEQNGGLNLREELNDLTYWGDDANLTIDEFMRRIVNDFVVHNTYAFKIRIKPTLTFNNTWRHKIYALDYIDPAQLRLESPNLLRGQSSPKGVYWCRDWEHPYHSGNDLTRYEMFSGLEPSFDFNEAIFYYSGTIEGSNWYPLPIYVGGMIDVESDYQISILRLKMVSNNLSVQAVAKLLSEPATEKEKIALESSLNNQFGNSSDTNLLIMYGQTGIDGNTAMPAFDYLSPPDPGKLFETMDTSLKRNILMLHRIPEALSMMGESNALITNTDGVLNAAAVFEHYVINPIKELPLEGLKRVLRYNLWGGEAINSLKLGRIDLPSILK